MSWGGYIPSSLLLEIARRNAEDWSLPADPLGEVPAVRGLDEHTPTEGRCDP